MKVFDMGKNLEHTPGPWAMWTNSDEAGELMEIGVDTEDRGAQVATVMLENLDFGCEEQAVADARLIAASPRLLEAAIEVMNYLAFMQATSNRKYPFRPSPEGEKKLAELGAAIKAAID